MTERWRYFSALNAREEDSAKAVDDNALPEGDPTESDEDEDASEEEEDGWRDLSLERSEPEPEPGKELRIDGSREEPSSVSPLPPDLRSPPSSLPSPSASPSWPPIPPIREAVSVGAEGP